MNDFVRQTRPRTIYFFSKKQQHDSAIQFVIFNRTVPNNDLPWSCYVRAYPVWLCLKYLNGIGTGQVDSCSTIRLARNIVDRHIYSIADTAFESVKTILIYFFGVFVRLTIENMYSSLSFKERQYVLHEFPELSPNLIKRYERTFIR